MNKMYVVISLLLITTLQSIASSESSCDDLSHSRKRKLPIVMAALEPSRAEQLHRLLHEGEIINASIYLVRSKEELESFERGMVNSMKYNLQTVADLRNHVIKDTDMHVDVKREPFHREHEKFDYLITGSYVHTIQYENSCFDTVTHMRTTSDAVGVCRHSALFNELSAENIGN